MEKLKLEKFLKLPKEDLRGKIICFPTDTVYGIGAMIDDSEAIEKIYAMKKRDKDKPLANLCSNIDQIYEYVENIPDKAYEIMNKFWPGALTIIFKKKKDIYVKNTIDTIGFRMPNSKIALDIIDHFSIMSTTSVNLTGERELNCVDDIEKEFSNDIDYLIINSALLSNIPSTVVDASNKDLKILRQGKILV